MTTKRFIGAVLGLVLLIIVGGASFLFGSNHALGALSVTTATADQIAAAMSDDNFYGLYRERTLLVQGTVAAVTQQGPDTVIQLQTSALFKAYCDIGSASTSLQAGNTASILAEGFTAERLSDGVMLTKCVVLQPNQ